MFTFIFAIECRRIKPYSAIICSRDSFANPLLQDAHNAILRSRKKDSTPLLPALMGLSIGQLNRREVAAPVGVGPFNRDNGRMRSKRATLSTSRLYIAALVAARHNPILRAFYLRLRAAGKPAKLALTATMRKL